MPDDPTRPAPRITLPPTQEHQPLPDAVHKRRRQHPSLLDFLIAVLILIGLCLGAAAGLTIGGQPAQGGGQVPIVAAPLTMVAPVIAAPTPEPPSYPYLSGITQTSHDIFARGQALGNRPDVFSKVGDSITVAPQFLTPIGTGMYDLHGNDYLAPVVAYYSQTVARDNNSFANTSLAAKGGWSAWTVLNPGAADGSVCFAGEQPLVCEYRVVRPSVALIMLGTNDAPTTPPAQYETWMREVIETSMAMGVIPVLSTIPEFHWENMEGRVDTINAIIVALAAEYDVPLWDYHAALAGVANEGLSDDGVHPSGSWSAPGADLSADNLTRYGMTVRNLTALQALDAIWRGVVQPGV